LTITGTVANQTLLWEGIGIANTDNTGTTSLALAVIGGAVAGTYVFKNCNIVGGSPTLNAGTAVSFTGNAGNGTILDIQSPSVIGGHYLNMLHAADQVIYRNCSFVCGPAIWMRIIGNAAGNVSVIASTLRGTTGTEYIEFGNGAAVTAILNLISSKLNCYLRLNTTAAGYVNIEDSEVTYITANQADQIVRYVNGDYITIQMMNIDLAPGAVPAPHTMYTVPALRHFYPERVVTTNRLADSHAALVYQYNGTAGGSVVGPVGAASLRQGSTINTCLIDPMAAAAVLEFSVTTASLTDADRGEAKVMGRLV